MKLQNALDKRFQQIEETYDATTEDLWRPTGGRYMHPGHFLTLLAVPHAATMLILQDMDATADGEVTARQAYKVLVDSDEFGQTNNNECEESEEVVDALLEKARESHFYLTFYLNNLSPQ